MQPKIIYNFRKRARMHGYRQIHIKCIGLDAYGCKIYQVSATEPLSKQRVVFTGSESHFNSLLRRGELKND